MQRADRRLAVVRRARGGRDVAVLRAVLFVLELMDRGFGGDQLGDDDLVVLGFF